MKECWKADPSSRPSFNTCKRLIATRLENDSPADYQLMKTILADVWRNTTNNCMPSPISTGAVTTPESGSTDYSGVTSALDAPTLNDAGLSSATQREDSSQDDSVEMCELYSSAPPCYVPKISQYPKHGFQTFSPVLPAQ